MNAFTFSFRRTSVVKCLVSLSILVYLLRGVFGAADVAVVAGVSMGGFVELFFVLLGLSALLLLWDIRDKLVN